MTYLEIDKALVDLTRQICEECKKRLDATPKEKRTERKALQVEYGMYTFCGNAGLFFNTVGERKLVQIRRRFWEREQQKYPHLKLVYQGLDDEKKMCFIAALQAEWYIRYYWFGAQKNELAAAEACGDTQKVFEFKIKVGSVERMFAVWEAWRRENGMYPNMFQEGKND